MPTEKDIAKAIHAPHVNRPKSESHSKAGSNWKRRSEVETKNCDYIEKALMSFKGDPPDSEFQRGYQAALACIVVEAPSSSGDYTEECVRYATEIHGVRV